MQLRTAGNQRTHYRRSAYAPSSSGSCVRRLQRLCDSCGVANSPSGDSMLDRFVRILDSFDTTRTSMSVATLARRAKLPLATTYRLVGDLTRHQLLSRGPSGEVSLGIRLWELVNRSSSTASLRQAAMPFMEDIHAVVRQHTQLAVLRDDEVLVIERLSTRLSVANQANIAGRLPVHLTALGMVLLAHSPVPAQESYLRQHPEASAEASSASFDFRRLLADIRQQGFASFDGRIDTTTTGLAVPVLHRSGTAAASLGVVIPRDSVLPQSLVPMLTAGARGISRAMGELPEPDGSALQCSPGSDT